MKNYFKNLVSRLRYLYNEPVINDTLYSIIMFIWKAVVLYLAVSLVIPLAILLFALPMCIAGIVEWSRLHELISNYYITGILAGFEAWRWHMFLFIMCLLYYLIEE